MNILFLEPSPTGLETMKSPKHQRKEFKFLPVALAGLAGELLLSPHGNHEEGSWVSEPSQTENKTKSAQIVRVKCEIVSSLMKKFGQTQVDLLKIGIK